MKITFYQQFLDHIVSLSNTQKQAMLDMVERFIMNPMHPLLKNTSFEGKLQDYGSLQLPHHALVIYHKKGMNQYEFVDYIKI